jgi:hypothetical protein
VWYGVCILQSVNNPKPLESRLAVKNSPRHHSNNILVWILPAAQGHWEEGLLAEKQAPQKEHLEPGLLVEVQES